MTSNASHAPRAATAPVPRALVRRLWYAVGAGALFLIVATIEGARRPDYDAWHQAVSALGTWGWPLWQQELLTLATVAAVYFMAKHRVLARYIPN